MKKRYSRVTLKSFGSLRDICKSVWGESKQVSMPESCSPEKISRPGVVDDSQLFLQTMADLKLRGTKESMNPLKASLSRDSGAEEVKDIKTLKNLDKLVTNGIASKLCFPEDFRQNKVIDYSVGKGMCYGFGRLFCDSLDLHGHTVAEAKAAFDEFIEESILLARSSILIIHGRGLCSSGEPILKKRVKEWLERGVRLNLLHSFSGARPEDGGEGATYVQLFDNG